MLIILAFLGSASEIPEVAGRLETVVVPGFRPRDDTSIESTTTPVLRLVRSLLRIILSGVVGETVPRPREETLLPPVETRPTATPHAP